MPRKLQVWNGRGDYAKLDGSIYVCASTKKRAVELVNQAGYKSSRFSLRELNNYFSNCWGNTMEKLVPIPEEGVWFDPKDGGQDSGKPVRLI